MPVYTQPVSGPAEQTHQIGVILNPLPHQVRLNNGVLMPTIGYGCAALGSDTATTATMALQAGYRHFDSAQVRGRC